MFYSCGGLVFVGCNEVIMTSWMIWKSVTVSLTD